MCKDLIDDLLSNVVIERDQKHQEQQQQQSTTASLHCSLPLDKVASVLKNCQESAAASATKAVKPATATVRHLCLYCDRKFPSIALRQRHTERVHQQTGGRRYLIIIIIE